MFCFLKNTSFVCLTSAPMGQFKRFDKRGILARRYCQLAETRSKPRAKQSHCVKVVLDIRSLH